MTDRILLPKAWLTLTLLPVFEQSAETEMIFIIITVNILYQYIVASHSTIAYNNITKFPNSIACWLSDVFMAVDADIN